jgi:hypothetical protein
MKAQNIPKPADIDIEAILASALTRKAELLTEFPQLKPLQQEFDDKLPRARSLADKFYTMAAAHARFHSRITPE